MRILHLNTFDHAGGAARAASWLHAGLRASGVESLMLVQHKTTGESAIKAKAGRLETLFKEIRWIIDGLPLLLYPKRDVTHWTTGWFPNRLARFVEQLNPDVIHLHWTCRGFGSIAEIGKLCHLGRPVVWTLHDSWAFTGGCHIPGTCLNYQNGCGACPQLGSRKKHDLSWLTLHHKKRKWQKKNLVIATPSQWLSSCAKKSSLFAGNRTLSIANGIDTEAFAPLEKKVAGSLLRLPDSGKKRILCGGINAHGDPNKGLHLMAQAMTSLVNDGWQDRIELVIYGESEPSPALTPPVTTHYLGTLRDDLTLRMAYSAADLFVLPSLQENLPNSIIESLACRTPVVAFATSGIPELVKQGVDGYLAKPFDAADLAGCIKLALEQSLQPALDPIFTQKHAAAAYQALYREVTGIHGS